MQIVAFKCKKCGWITEDAEKYDQHMKVHLIKEVFEKRFPRVENWGYSRGVVPVQRTAEWLAEYKAAVEDLIPPKSYPAWSYGWFRCLDDGGSPFYALAGRALHVCPKCFREWDQPYHANHCTCNVRCAE